MFDGFPRPNEVKLHARANDWKDDDANAKVEAMKTLRTEALSTCGGEQWIIMRAIRYNEWASFTKKEFRAVVEAFKTRLLQFRCVKPGCESWLNIAPRKVVELVFMRRGLHELSLRPCVRRPL